MMYEPKPEWLKIRIRSDRNKEQVKEILERLSLNTVCKEANCPNLMECFCSKTATFMILGRTCTRNCTFCNVTKGITENVDAAEPAHVARAVKELGLKHAVVTSVTRDDLTDGGAGHFAEVVREINQMNPGVTVEVLIPDFQGDKEALRKVLEAKPDILNHNFVTVERLYPEVRPMASYGRSLKLLEEAKDIDSSILTKSGIMVGLGEKKEEVLQVFEDLRKSGCNLLTIGQYLAPSKSHHTVVEYIHPDLFDEYKKAALKIGFEHVVSSPFARSSYHAAEVFEG
jgi:lipoic acid synthetase